MLDRETRSAILRLNKEGHGIRKIAKDLGISRTSVREVIESGSCELPKIERSRILESDMELIREIYQDCKGNMVRVQEVLLERDIQVKYSTLTKLGRDFHISRQEKVPVSRIVTDPGEEGQHDTSPHKMVIGGRRVVRHCGSYVLGFSRRIYIQFYPKFDRFHCKLFLSEAFQYMNGAARRCVIDNTHVVIVCGTGKRAQFSPEMEAFEKRYGFQFMAHEVGDYKRKGKVERPFDYIERNFLAGRRFKDDADLNRQAIEWLNQKANVRLLREFGQTPNERFAIEQPYLVPLPLYIPEVYRLHQRVVDVYGYVSLDGYKYSVPATYISKEVDMRETKDQVIVLHGHQEIARHKKLTEFDQKKHSTLPEHRRSVRRKRSIQILEETKLKSMPEPMPTYLTFLKKEYGHRYIYSIKQLYRLYCEYREQDLIAAVGRALKYRLRDVRRLEDIILNQIAKKDFMIPIDSEPFKYQDNPSFIKGGYTPEQDLLDYASEDEEEGENNDDRGDRSLSEGPEIKKDRSDS